MEIKENLHLKNLRMERGLTQQDVADAIGVTKATISKYEKGQRRINVDVLEKLADFFRVEPIYILTGKTNADWEKQSIKNVEDAMQDERSYWESVLLTDAVVELMPLLDRLNEEGQRKAVERVAELTEVPKYQRSEDIE